MTTVLLPWSSHLFLIGGQRRPARRSSTPPSCPPPSEDRATRSLRTFAGFLILTVYAVSSVADIALDSYQTPVELHLAAAAVIAYLFGQDLLNGKRKGKP